MDGADGLGDDADMNLGSLGKGKKDDLDALYIM